MQTEAITTPSPFRLTSYHHLIFLCHLPPPQFSLSLVLHLAPSTCHVFTPANIVRPRGLESHHRRRGDLRITNTRSPISILLLFIFSNPKNTGVELKPRRREFLFLYESDEAATTLNVGFSGSVHVDEGFKKTLIS
ncbi:unnamed protein product [Malus baccata var. baccata]